jgi:hypothetical protein
VTSDGESIAASGCACVVASAKTYGTRCTDTRALLAARNDPRAWCAHGAARSGAAIVVRLSFFDRVRSDSRRPRLAFDALPRRSGRGKYRVGFGGSIYAAPKNGSIVRRVLSLNRGSGRGDHHLMRKIDLQDAGRTLARNRRAPHRGDAGMSNKSSPGTVTSTEVREMLRTAAQRLTAREEKILRMRQGACLDRGAALPRRGQQDPQVRAELLALEVELVQKLSQRAQTAATPVRTKEKDKIIRALRRLK